MTKRLASFLLAFLLLITSVPLFAITANAAYENTYTNTGNQAADILGVALTQVGYTEGPNNDTKYGDWYGLPNHAWCGMFVSWCANQAGIPTSVLKKYARSNPAGYGLAELDGRSYRPKPGDLFFSRSYSHVGLVYYLDGDYFYTLEGNSGGGSNRVCSQRKPISNYLFGSPNYRGGGNHSYTTNYESSHPHKEYMTCSHCSDKYYTGKTTTLSSCKTCVQNSCSHSFGVWSIYNDRTHSRICSKCEYSEVKDHNWNTDAVIQEANCSVSGSKKQTCTDCGTGRTVTIPKTNSHTYSTVTFVDDTYHRHVCNVCKQQETLNHSGADQWQNDDTSHWHQCTECNERYLLGEHTFPDGCASACQDCGFVNPEGHILKDTPSSDNSGHWYDCENCNNKVDFTEHNYTAECAEQCSGCSFTRQTVHSFSETMCSDETSHWIECSVCGQIKDKVAHLPDTNVEQWETQLCTACNYILRSSEDHVHSFDAVHHDNRTHWGTCACGFEMGSEAHSWSMQTKKCSICNADSVAIAKTEETTHLLYWSALALACVGLFVAVAILLSRMEKKLSRRPRKRVKTIAYMNSMIR